MKRSQQAEDYLDDACITWVKLWKRGKNHEAVGCMEENLEHWSREAAINDPILEPKHKIFLSHSGVQKEFVEFLCEALERRNHCPFFDRRPTSLPKGERYPELILKAARQCQMAVVVVSEDYFMSKWPMIELHVFMQAYKSNIKLKIFPLFYGLSVEEFGDEGKRERWYKQWESFAKDDAKGRINVNEWKDALNVLGSFNGRSYNQKSKEIVAFRDCVVIDICLSISPDVKWDDSFVQGKSTICEVTCKRIDQMKLSQKYKIKVVGIHGVGGIGKTTLCKTLCNVLSRKFEGNVCYAEFQSKDIRLKELLEQALVCLSGTSLEVLQRWNVNYCKRFLYEILESQRTFLAVDNVWDTYESIKQAKMFLEAPFHEGSLVIVTSRSRSTLEILGITGDACLAMPELEKQDAVNLLLYHAARGKQFRADEDKLDIELCVDRCYFRKGDRQGCHYHPLALEALGLQLGCVGDTPSEWLKNLPKVRNFSYLSGQNPVFDILRSSFDLLLPSEQSLFMDMIFYRPTFVDDVKEWLCPVYKVDEAEINSRLDCLRRRGLLHDVDMASGTLGMHDLYMEFAELEVRGRLDESTALEKRRWVYVDNGDLSELESTPSGRCWQKLIRLGIYECMFSHIGTATDSLEGIEWENCSNVEVLKLHGLDELRGLLNLERLKCLRSLELYGIGGLDRLEGLQGLRNLSYFSWYYFDPRGNEVQTYVGQFPASLRVLYVAVRVLLGADVLARCKNLCKLVLREIRDDSLDLSNCSSLECVMLQRAPKLRTLSKRLNPSCASTLQSLVVDECWDLVDIPGLEQLASLELLELKDCKVKPELHPVILRKLTKLQVKYKLSNQQYSTFCFSQDNQELNLCWTSESPNFSGLEQLQVLDLIGNWENLELMGDLPALRLLNLSYCKALRLPDLSKSVSLEELNLQNCRVDLHEEDIRILAGLPLLQPVPIGECGNVRLDLVRRKGLYHMSGMLATSSWGEWYDWKERDLGIPPYKIRPGCIWDCI